MANQSPSPVHQSPPQLRTDTLSLADILDQNEDTLLAQHTATPDDNDNNVDSPMYDATNGERILEEDDEDTTVVPEGCCIECKDQTASIVAYNTT